MSMQIRNIVSVVVLMLIFSGQGSVYLVMNFLISLVRKRVKISFSVMVVRVWFCLVSVLLCVCCFGVIYVQNICSLVVVVMKMQVILSMLCGRMYSIMRLVCLCVVIIVFDVLSFMVFCISMYIGQMLVMLKRMYCIVIQVLLVQIMFMNIVVGFLVQYFVKFLFVYCFRVFGVLSVVMRVGLFEIQVVVFMVIVMKVIVMIRVVYCSWYRVVGSCRWKKCVVWVRMLLDVLVRCSCVCIRIVDRYVFCGELLIDVLSLVRLVDVV